MTIPTTSIEGISTPMMRDGTILATDTSLAAVAGQVLEQGEEFRSAVEQFQLAMAGLDEFGGAVATSATPSPGVHGVRTRPEVEVVGHPEIGEAGASPAPVGSPLQGAPLPSSPLSENGVVPPSGTEVTGVPPAPVGSPLQGAPLPTPPLSENGVVPPSGTAVTGVPPTPVGSPLQGAPLTAPHLLENSVVPLSENGVEPTPGIGVAGVPSAPVEAPLRDGPTKVPTNAPLPLRGDGDIAIDTHDHEENEMPTVLQAAPLAITPAPQAVDAQNVAVEPVQVVAARVIHQVTATPAQVLIEAAAAVADTIVVSPGLLRGSGEIQVQLRPDVLDGTVIHISTTSPGALSVQFSPTTENMAVLLEKCAPQLVTYLSERIYNFQVAVNVKRDDKSKG